MSEFEYDPHGKVASHAVTEVRTVLSRARTALEMVEGGEGPQIIVGTSRYDQVEKQWIPAETIPLPDGPEMVEALRQVVVLLSPWENRASRRRGAR